MSKLFKLKKWLTIAQAAKYLSSGLSEEVKEADVLDLGLDGHLTLSVCFLNDAYARPWIPVKLADLDRVGESPGGEMYIEMTDGDYHLYAEGDKRLSESIVKLADVAWDLPLISAERFKVRTAITRLMVETCQEINLGGSKVTTIASPSGVLYELQERVCDTQVGSHEFNTTIDPQLHSDFRSALKLPEDSILVVRTEVLSGWLMGLSNEPKDEPKLAPKKETSYLNLIGVLVKLLQDVTIDDLSNKTYKNGAGIKRKIEDRFSNTPGVGERTLDKVFAESGKSLDAVLVSAKHSLISTNKSPWKQTDSPQL